MRFAIGFAVFFAFTGALLAQGPAFQEPELHVHKLSIISADLPASERKQIIHAFAGSTYSSDELQERIRQQLRDTGYFDPSVELRKLEFVSTKEPVYKADLKFTVRAGEKYHVGEIIFEGAKTFPPEHLRSLFPASGTLFNATAIGKSLENLKELYGTAGYINFGAIPKPMLDSGRHVVDLTIAVDQGAAFTFGTLLFEGVEPRAGIANDLLASWNLNGKRYNPQSLNNWLKGNTSSWPPEWRHQIRSDSVQDPERRVANVLLHFQ